MYNIHCIVGYVYCKEGMCGVRTIAINLYHGWSSGQLCSEVLDSDQ